MGAHGDKFFALPSTIRLQTMHPRTSQPCENWEMENPTIQNAEAINIQRDEGATQLYTHYLRIVRRLLPPPQELAGETPPASTGNELTAQIEALARAFEAERRRGMERHWTYDPNRLAALAQARELARELLQLLHPASTSPAMKKAGRALHHSKERNSRKNFDFCKR